MNREIKFRVWVDDEKKFKYCQYIPTMGFVWETDGIKNYIEIGENYPQQYTGFKDSKDKEIYDGDIIEYENKSTRLVRWTIEGVWEAAPLDKNYCIEFDINDPSGYIGCSGYDDASLCWSGGACNEPIVIIGNIYENPELLK